MAMTVVSACCVIRMKYCSERETHYLSLLLFLPDKDVHIEYFLTLVSFMQLHVIFLTLDRNYETFFKLTPVLMDTNYTYMSVMDW